MNVSPVSNKFITDAKNYGVTAGYSGKVGKMLVSGEDKKVKAFIRVQCLKGKNFYPFAFGQGVTSPSV